MKASAAPVPVADTSAAERIHVGTLVTWLLISLLGVYLVFIVGGFPGIYQVQWRLVTHVLTLALIVGWVLAVAWRPGLFVLPRLALPIAAVLLAMTVSTNASPYPRFGWETVINAAATALVFAVLVSLLAIPAMRGRLRFTAAALIIGIVVAYAAQLLLLWVQFWSLVGDLVVPPLRPAFAGLIYGTPNIPAGAVVAFLPLVIAWLEGSSLRPITRRAAIVGLVAVGLFDLLVSGSRGAQLGFAVAILVGGALLLIDHRSAVAGLRARLADRRLLALLVGGVVVVVAAIVILGPGIVGRVFDAGANLRLTFWEHSLAAFAGAPLTGTGPGTWAFAQWAYGTDRRPLDVVAHAHDAPIQLGAEMGVIGLVAGAIFVVGVTVLLRRGWFALPRLEVIAVAMGLAGLAGQCLVDNFSDLPLFVGGAAFLLAWIEGGLARPFQARDGGRVRVAAAGTLVVIAITSIAVILPWDRAAVAYLDGVTAQDRGDWPAAASAYTLAATDDPDYPQYRRSLGVALDWAGAPEQGAVQLAVGARQVDDPFMAVNAALAVLAAGGPADLAGDLLDEATAHGAVHVDLALDAGAVAEQLGHTDEAIHHYATAIALQPDLMASAYWRDPGRPASKEAIGEAAVARLRELERLDYGVEGAEMGIRAGLGQWDRAREIAGNQPIGPSRDATLASLAAMQGDPAGLEALRHLNADTDGAFIGALASAADRFDDPDADRYRAWAAIVSSGSDRAGRTSVLAQGGGETAAYFDLGPAIAEEVYLRDRGFVTQVRDALQVGFR